MFAIRPLGSNLFFQIIKWSNCRLTKKLYFHTPTTLLLDIIKIEGNFTFAEKTY